VHPALKTALRAPFRALGYDIVRHRPSYPSYRYLGDGLGLTALASGAPFIIDLRSLDIGLGILWTGRYEADIERHILGPLAPGMTFIDAGANIGYYAVMAAQAVGPGGTVMAFEPNPRAFSILDANLRANGKPHAAHRLALGNENGETSLSLDPNENGGACIWHEGCPESSQRLPVKIGRLDDLIPAGCAVDVIKIDAEGYEPEILLGAQETLRRSRKLRIVAEFMPNWWRGRDPAAVLHMLAGMGFELSLVRPQRLEPMTPAQLLEASRVHGDVLTLVAERRR